MNNIEFYNKSIPLQPPEREYGNREYKLSLDYSQFDKKKSQTLLTKKASQMLYRINEGDGKALYIIGVRDNGYNIGISIKSLIITLINFIKITHLIECKIYKLRIYKGLNGYIMTIRVKKNISKFNLEL